MVEVLVTLVLLSVGLMGIAKLQLVSLRSVHASTVRGQAVLLAYDLADRMRANRFGESLHQVPEWTANPALIVMRIPTSVINLRDFKTHV